MSCETEPIIPAPGTSAEFQTSLLRRIENKISQYKREIVGALTVPVLAVLLQLAEPQPPKTAHAQGYDPKGELVYEYQGDIYSIVIGERIPTRLTRTASVERNPKYSRDGREILFVREEISGRSSLNIMDANGENSRQIAQGSRGTWNPEGQKAITYIREELGRKKLVIKNLANGQEKVLLQNPRNLLFFNPEWSPKGDFLALEVLKDISAHESSIYLFLYDRTRGELGAPIILEEVGQIYTQPSFSRDGRYLSFIRWFGNSGPQLREFDVFAFKMFDYFSPFPVQSNGGWSRDRHFLAYAASNGEETGIYARDGNPYVTEFHKVIDLPGRELSPDWKREEKERERRQFWHPSFEGKLVYVSDRDRDEEVFTVDEEGNHVQLTRNRVSDRTPEWSPDGETIVFISERDGQSNVFLMDEDGKNQRVFARRGVQPTWHPSGKKIAFVQYSLDFSGDVLIEKDLKTGKEKVLLVEEFIGSPDFSPDGSLLAYEIKVDGGRSVIAISSYSDGGLLDTSILRYESFYNDRLPRFSPDGRFLSFVANSSSVLTIDFLTGDYSYPGNYDVVLGKAAWAPSGRYFATSGINDFGDAFPRVQYVLLKDSLGINYILWDGFSLDWQPKRTSSDD